MAKLDITKNNIPISEYFECRRGILPRKSIPFQKPRGVDGYIYVIEGSCRYTFDDGTEFEAKKDGILYLAKGAIYKMEINCDKYEFFVANFNFGSVAPRQSAFYTLLSPPSAERLFSRLCYTHETQAHFAKSMAVMYQLTAAITESKDRAYIGSDARIKIERAADFIHLNFANEGLSIASLATDAGMSEVYFRKLFALRFGMPPSRYIMQTRISRALELMSFENLSLDEISEKSGFSSLPYFSRVFKSFTGDTPASYRRSVSKQNNMT